MYIFAGGFTVGVKRVGFRVLGHLEDGPFGVSTTKRNHPELAGHVHTDPASWPLDEFRAVDFVYGNPPCAPWSQAGMSWKGSADPTRRRGLTDNWWERDPRVSCVYQMFDVLEKVRPRVWAWESVARAAVAGRPLIDSLAERAATLGYACSLVLLNGADVGVPQDRKRVFVVFHAVDVPWQLAPLARVSVREALAGVVTTDAERALARRQSPTVTKTFAEMGAAVRPGASLAQEFNKLHGTTYTPGQKVKGRPAFLYRKLGWDQLAFTTTGAARHFHPEEPRLLTVREQAALCGYPPDYQWPDNANQAYEHMSKAVLPAAGQWLAENVRRGLEANLQAAPGTRVHDFIDVAGPALTTRGVVEVQRSTPALPGRKASQVARVTESVMATARAARVLPPSHEPAVPAQLSTLPIWEQFTGPTAIARALIAEGHADGPILAATGAAIRGAAAAGATWPRLFTRVDLIRLRERIARNATKADA